MGLLGMARQSAHFGQIHCSHTNTDCSWIGFRVSGMAARIKFKPMGRLHGYILHIWGSCTEQRVQELFSVIFRLTSLQIRRFPPL